MDVLGEGGLLEGQQPARVHERLALAERLASSPDVVDRIRATPPTYATTQSGEALARQATLLESLPARGRAHVDVSPAERPSEWHVDVACRDQHGLLALVTGLLAGAGLDVVSAAATTWGDGAAIDAFVVRAAGRPDQSTLEVVINAGLRSTISAPAVNDASVAFDDVASPWYTLCEIHAGDRPGLLHTLAAAITAAGANVHGATIATDGTIAVDRFELTDTRAQARRRGQGCGRECGCRRCAAGRPVATAPSGRKATQPKHSDDRREIFGPYGRHRAVKGPVSYSQIGSWRIRCDC